MTYILICLVIYGVLIAADIIPSIKKKQWKELSVSLPIYFITLVLNVLIGLGIELPSPNKILEVIIGFIFPIK